MDKEPVEDTRKRKSCHHRDFPSRTSVLYKSAKTLASRKYHTRKRTPRNPPVRPRHNPRRRRENPPPHHHPRRRRQSPSSSPPQAPNLQSLPSLQPLLHHPCLQSTLIHHPPHQRQRRPLQRRRPLPLQLHRRPTPPPPRPSPAFAPETAAPPPALDPGTQPAV